MYPIERTLSASSSSGSLSAFLSPSPAALFLKMRQNGVNGVCTPIALPRIGWVTSCMDENRNISKGIHELATNSFAQQIFIPPTTTKSRSNHLESLDANSRDNKTMFLYLITVQVSVYTLRSSIFKRNNSGNLARSRGNQIALVMKSRPMFRSRGALGPPARFRARLTFETSNGLI